MVDSTMISEECLQEFSKRQNIRLFSDSSSDESFVVIDKAYTEEISWTERMRIINEVVLFRDLLSLDEITGIVEDSEVETFKEGQLIVKKGMKTEKVYILCSGEVILNSNETQTMKLRKSDILCWDTLFAGSKIVEHSAVCITDTILLSMRRELCQFIIRPQNLRKIEKITLSSLPTELLACRKQCSLLR